MFGRKVKTNKASIAKKSNGNLIFQDNVLNNPILVGTSSEVIQMLGKAGQYDSIQNLAKSIFGSVEETHPLFPEYRAKFDYELNKLISSPETEEAIRKYPKSIKSKFLINYEEYPHMDRSETPWEYAYRTQTQIEVETTAYQEYLGDREDPFPIFEFKDGMRTIIKPPEFPKPVKAMLLSGDVAIPIMLRRKPCLEFGKMIIGTVDENLGFEFQITTSKEKEFPSFTISRLYGCDLQTQLQREKFINQMRITKKMTILIGDSKFVEALFEDNDFPSSFVNGIEYLIQFLENLLVIERHTGCKFDLTAEDVTMDDYRTAYIIASSLEGKWHRIKMVFDDEERCDYDQLPESLEEFTKNGALHTLEGRILRISLYGVKFSAEKYLIVYEDACINNIKSVLKNRKKKRKNILITFRPTEGKEYFYKYCKIEGIKVIPEFEE